MTTNELKSQFYSHLSKDESIFQFIQTSASGGLWFWNPLKPEETWHSDGFWKLLGYNPDEVDTYPDWDKLIHPDDRNYASRKVRLHLEDNNNPYDVVLRFYTKDGSIVWLRSRGKAIYDETPYPVGMLGTYVHAVDAHAADVHATDVHVTDSEQQSDTSFAHSPLAEAVFNNEDVYILTISREGVYSYLSPSLCRDLGTDPKNIAGQSALITVIPEDHHKCIEAAEFCVLNPRKSFHTTLRKKFRNGSLYVTQWEFIGLLDSSGQVGKILGIGLDITKLAEAEAQRDYLTSIFESAEAIANLGGWDYQVASDTSTNTKQFYAIHEVDTNFSFSSETELQFYHPEDRPKILQALGDAVSKRRPFDITTRFITSKNNHRWVRLMGVPSGGRATATNVRGVIQDITEQKNAEIALQNLIHEKQQLIEEKDALLKEIHYRVKNNLQLVASLLSLQARNLTDIDGRIALESSYKRMLAMASVHKALYESKSLSRVDFKRYLRELVDNTVRTIRTFNIDVLYDLKPITLTIRDAIPCGLIANEFVMNVIKHAFSIETPNPRLTGI